MGFIQQFVVSGLGHSCHLVGSRESGSAALVDPGRDVADYLDAARDAGVEIRWVLDTHGHNDYLSGLAEIAELTGATPIAPIGASVAYTSALGWHGRSIDLGGGVLLELLHTPGHTAEHTAVLAHGIGSGPVLLSGGSLLVGDVGRPDLGGNRDPEQLREAALALTHSVLDVLLALGDDTTVLPTHVGGSLCAGSIAPGTQTTIGEQRTTSPTVQAMLATPDDPSSWLRVDTLPPIPEFWPHTRAANLRGVPAPSRTPLAQLAAADISADALVLDVRDAASFADGHLPRSVNAPLGGSFEVWAGIVALGVQDVVLVADDEQTAVRAQRSLLHVHVTGARGWFAAADVVAGPAHGDAPVEPEVAIADVAAGRRVLVDVRNPAEVAERPIVGATVIPAAVLLADPGSAPDGPLAIACASGYRAQVVATVLRRARPDADVLAVVGSPVDAARALLASAV